jgi:hypothetical protein
LQTLLFQLADLVALLFKLPQLRMEVGSRFDLCRGLKTGVGKKLLLLLLFI